jgi:hypothetical protein
MENSDGFSYKYEEFGLLISIASMEKSLREQIEGIDSMKSTARTLLGATSLIVSLLGTLQLINASVVEKHILTFNSLLFLSMLIYGVQFILCVLLLYPKDYYSPIEANWDILYKGYIKKEKADILRQQLSNTLNAIKNNKGILRTMEIQSRWASILLPAVVTLLLSLSFIPR